MKKLNLLILSLLVIGSFAFAQSINVTSPNGGEEWEKGTSHDITWTATGLTNDVKITLWKNGVLLGLIAKDIDPSSGSYPWTVGTYIGGTAPADVDYKIKIREQGGESFTTEDMSDGNFTVSTWSFSGFEQPEPDKIPDLVIDSITRSPKHPVMGETFTFKFSVFNMGNGTADASVAKISIKGPNTAFFKKLPVRILNGHSLPFNPMPDSTWLSEEFKFSKWGIYKFTVRLDVDKNVTESDENNNEKFILVDVSPVPDLIVCISNNKRPGVGKKTSIHATVKNVGEFQSAPCKLRFYVEKKGTNEYDIPVLHPGKTHKITREERWGLAGTRTISAIIDYYKKIREFREDNNRAQSSYFVRLPHHKKTTHPPYSICSSKAFNKPW
ncbi:MAG: CARDB domain-containing protein [Acidobacteriota bacterium]